MAGFRRGVNRQILLLLISLYQKKLLDQLTEYVFSGSVLEGQRYAPGGPT